MHMPPAVASWLPQSLSQAPVSPGLSISYSPRWSGKLSMVAGELLGGSTLFLCIAWL